MIGCSSHNLNLEVNKMIADVPDMHGTVQKVHMTMKAAKKLKNKAMLRNRTRFSPLLPNATRWSGKCHMVNRFLRIRTELITVSNEESCVLPIDASPRFSQKAKAYGLMFREINSFTQSISRRAAGP